mgnify:FL=1
MLFAFYMVIRNYKDELSKYLICLFSYLLFELIIYKFNVKIDFYFYSIRYLYFLLIIVFLKTYNKSNRNDLLKYLDAALFLNSVLIIVGVCFRLYIFKTYNGDRLGYNGILNMVSDTNYIYGFYILVNLFKPIIGRSKIIILINITVATLAGTKTVIFLTLLFLVIKLFKFNKKLFYALAGTSVIGFLVFKNFVINKLLILTKEHVGIYNDHGLLSSLTSTRFSNLTNTIKSIFNSDISVIDFVFYNRNFINYRVEMELFDLFFFWGALGSVLFLFIIYRTNKIIIHQRDYAILISLFIISCFAGKLLTNFTSLLIVYSFLTSKPSFLNEKN